MIIHYSLTLALSAFLLFVVQPFTAKLLLPVLGSTPAVWNTCMVFFQAMLLAGYAYAHGSIRALGVRRQAAVHLVLMLAAAAALPLSLRSGDPPVDDSPVGWVFWTLLLGVGAPTFIVAASAPLLQRWLASTDLPEAENPYFLYVASNAGSAAALIAYPTLVEPNFNLAGQAAWWTWGYAALVAATGWAATLVWRRGEEAGPQLELVEEAPPTLGDRLQWLLLSAVPTSLLLGVTQHITTDVASAPMLWIPPLFLYLVTFMLAFARRSVPQVVLRVLVPWAVGLHVVLAATINFLRLGVTWRFGAEVLVFFLVAWACHGELARRRPAPHRLTEFYLWMSAGGLLGGILNGILAPILFHSIAEYPLALMAACLLIPGWARIPFGEAGRWCVHFSSAAAVVAAGVLVYTRRSTGGEASGVEAILLCGAAPMAIATLVGWPPRIGLAVGLFLIRFGLDQQQTGRDVIFAGRSFFGQIQVVKVSDLSEEGGDLAVYHWLKHGNIDHGRQARDHGRECEPLSYFDTRTAIGEAMEWGVQQHPAKNVAVVGLGSGCTFAFAKPGQHFTYYEIDPLIQKLAETPAYFSFLKGCGAGASYEIVLGDGRRSISRAPAGRFDLIALDAFSSDAIPIHLITKEAVQLYFDKLSDEGVVVFQVTNRYVDLEPILARIAHELNLAGITRYAILPEQDYAPDSPAITHAVVLARRMQTLKPLAARDQWRDLATRPNDKSKPRDFAAWPLWTDEFSNLIKALYW